MTEPPSQQPRAEASATEAGDLAWHRFGDGPPLLLLHGGHGNWQHWLRNIEERDGQQSESATYALVKVTPSLAMRFFTVGI